MQLNSHNMRIIPEITHYDSFGNKTKTISQAPENIIGEDSNIELTLYEADGTVKDTFILPFRSFGGQWAEMFNGRTTLSSANITFTDTGNVSRSVPAYNNIFAYNAFGIINNSLGGIVVGASGSAAATQSIDNYKLAGQINHGTAVGQLSHAAQIVDTTVTEISGSYVFSILRTFTNNSAGSTNVKEVGVYFSTYSSQFKWMGARDVVDSNGNDINITVAPTQVLTVKYNFYIPRQSGLTKAVAAFLLSEMKNGTTVATGSSALAYDDYYGGAAAVATNNNYQHHMLGSADTGYIGVHPGIGEATESAFVPGDVPIYVGVGIAKNSLIFNVNQADGLVKTYSTSGSAVEWNLKRTFTNGYTDPITIKEAMIICDSGNSFDNGLKTTTSKFVYARKLIGDQTIASGSSLEINFKFMIEV